MNQVLPIQFAKYQGNGNDFILIESEHRKHSELLSLLKQAAPKICDRHLGVGADGIILLVRDSSPKLTVVNRDGSLAKNCGNGLRAVAQYYFDKNTDWDQVHLELDGRVYECKKVIAGIYVDMGICRVSDEIIVAGLTSARVFKANIGNDHLVIIYNKQDYRELLHAVLNSLENAHDFNINLVTLKDQKIRSRVYERGVGFTKSCGSGAIATACVLKNMGATNADTIVIKQPGGLINVTVKPTAAGDFRVWQTATANRVFRGELEIMG